MLGRQPLILAGVAVLLAGCGGSDGRRGSLTHAEQANACFSVRSAVAQFAREHPEVPTDEVRRQVEANCHNGFPVATPSGRPEYPPMAGCHSLNAGDEHPARLRRIRAASPQPPIPFFAERAGALPANGTPTVGGVRLPRGSRCLHHWATDEPLAQPERLAARLAKVFPKTGLWPVVWEVGFDDPDSYMFALDDRRGVSRLSASKLLGRVWTAWRVGPGRFPGLASGTPGAGSGAIAADPFATLARAREAEYQTNGLDRVLLLVPCNRPADVLSVLGPEASSSMSNNALSAVLRSWEQRFGAVVTSVGPASVGVVVDAPPRSDDQARRLAAEQVAFAPGDERSKHTLAALAGLLRSPDPNPDGRWRHYWEFSLAD
jgi:hypothetical protein